MRRVGSRRDAEAPQAHGGYGPGGRGHFELADEWLQTVVMEHVSRALDTAAGRHRQQYAKLQDEISQLRAQISGRPAPVAGPGADGGKGEGGEGDEKPHPLSVGEGVEDVEINTDVYR